MDRFIVEGNYVAYSNFAKGHKFADDWRIITSRSKRPAAEKVMRDVMAYRVKCALPPLEMRITDTNPSNV